MGFFKITTDEHGWTRMNTVFGAIRSLVVSIIFVAVVFAFSGLYAGERDEMDQILQKELGFDSSKTASEDNSKKPHDKKNEPVNPVEEREH